MFDPDLPALGWDESWSASLASSLLPARVAAVERGRVLLLGCGLPWAAFSPRPRNPLEQPTVGDWVAIRAHPDRPVVEAVLPRRSVFVRRAAGRETRPQLVAANVDRLLVVTAIGADLNPRRIERYLAAALAGGAAPSVVVNKADLPHHRDEVLGLLGFAAGVPVIFTSALENDAGALAAHLRSGETVAFVGSSGVGKSSLINRLLGEDRLRTGEIRYTDEKGRHTSTRRELSLTPGGAIVIDTPGMRELGLWDAEEGLAAAFPEIDDLAARCRFRDCRHRDEPGCAVLSATAAGDVDEQRLESWRELAVENEATRSRHEEAAWRKSASRSLRSMRKLHRKLGLKSE